MARPLGDLVHIRRGPDYGGQWLAGPAPVRQEAIRERIGRHVSTTLDGAAGMGIRVTDNLRLLGPDQLWLVYARTPDVRAAIDGIARRIATWAWTLEIEGLDPDDEAYDEALEQVESAKRFLSAPNGNGETWQELMTKVVVDLLVYEHGVIEEVYNRLVTVQLPRPGAEKDGDAISVKVPATNAKLTELVALNGASVQPMTDGYGRLWAYQQDVYATLGQMAGGDGIAAPVFSRDQIVSFSLFPNTSGRTSPLIETLVNEIIAIMRASEHSMLAMDADEIPPGILVLTGVAGKAAEQAKTDLQRLRGKDHKIRVITNPDPKGTGAHWVELRRTPKDLALIDVVREIRRTIWRVFGVMPIEMGDSQDMPRAVGQVQLDVSSSHLVEPILDLLEAKINARILPLLVGDFAGKILLRFDREAKLSTGEQREKADALVMLVREGLISRNEARREIDHDPIEGGDIATISTAGGLTLVSSLGRPEEPDPDDDEPGPEGALVAPDEPGPGPDPDDEAPGEIDGDEPPVEASPGEVVAENTRLPMRRTADGLPSGWPSEALFAGRRTVDLRALADAVERYTRLVGPLYRECADEVIAAVSRRYDGGIEADAAQLAVRDVDAAFAKLRTRWQAAAEPLYEATALSARNRAVDFTGAQVLEDWRERGAAFGARAIGYLTAAGGLISDVRASVVGMLGAATGPSPVGRAVKPAKGIAPGIDEGQLLASMFGVFSGAEHRIENWSGKLVELASETLTAGLSEQPETEWWYEWVAVGDAEVCETCAREGAIGFRPVSQLRVHPGSSTRCGARCRCCLVYWTRAEVSSGEAVRLSGLAPGNKPL